MNVTAFFCDIRGTFEWELGEEYLVKNFTKKLSDLRKANKLTKLNFRGEREVTHGTSEFRTGKSQIRKRRM